MDNYLDGSWEECEQWIRNTIGSALRASENPMGKQSSREMIVDLVQSDTS